MTDDVDAVCISEATADPNESFLKITLAVSTALPMGKVISPVPRGFRCIFVVVLLIVAVQSEDQISNNETVCGVRQLGALGLMVKGVNAEPGDWPWHVALFGRKQGETPSYTCGGSIISRYFVLTAAHCFKEPNPARYFFKAGVHHLSNDADPDVITYQLYEIILHPKYNRQFYNDIALVRPDRPMVFTNNNVNPICVWSGSANSIDVFKHPGISVGFGFNENHTITDTLQQAAMSVTEKQLCIQLMPVHLRYLPQDEGKMCAIGTTSGSNVCSGDSGGGLFFAKDQVWYLRGIVSAAARRDLDSGLTTCDTSLPATYTDVSKYTGWIEAHEKIVDELNLLKLDECGVVRHANVSDEADKPVFNQYPWNALLEFRETNKAQIHLVCNGVLVHPRYVLTVGHCIDGILNGYRLASVRLGEYNIRTTEDFDPTVPDNKTTTQSVDVEAIIRHPNLNAPMYSNDLALVKLKHDADISKSNIKPICLPSLDDFKESGLTLSGWKRNKFVFPKLERDAMNLSSTVGCRNEYKKLGMSLPSTDDIVCAIYKHRSKADCNNYATGSALQYIKVVDKKPRYFLAGLMVFNFPYCRMNGLEMFVSLNSATEWIKRMVK